VVECIASKQEKYLDRSRHFKLHIKNPKNELKNQYTFAKKQAKKKQLEGACNAKKCFSMGDKSCHSFSYDHKPQNINTRRSF